MKYKVLLADDDIPILEWLKDMDWASINCQVVAACTNGEQALAYLERENVHVVVTDIVMPSMNGLQFAQELRKRNECTQIILISSYCDFEYARSAIKEDVKDYLIKGLFSQEELFETVRASIARYERFCSKQDVVCPEEYPAACSLLVYEPGIPVEQIYDALGEGVFTIPVSLKHAACVLMPQTAAACMTEKYENLLNPMLHPNLARSVTACVCEETVNSCAEANERLKILSQAAFFDGPAIRLLGREQKLWPIDPIKEDLLWHQVSMKGSAELLNFLQLDADAMFQRERIHPANIRRILTRWILGYAPRNSEEFVSEAVQAATLKQLTQILLRVVMQEKEMPNELYEALFYVQNNYQKPITLREVARQSGYTTNYFGTMFSRRMGMHFRTYLNQVRLEHACQLLQSTSMSAQEIMHRVGFSDYSYFSNLYKEKFGVTPQLSRRSKKT